MNKNCPKCGTMATKITLKDELIGDVLNGIIHVVHKPTIGFGHIAIHLFKNVYRCPNCGHKWTGKRINQKKLSIHQ